MTIYEYRVRKVALSNASEAAYPSEDRLAHECNYLSDDGWECFSVVLREVFTGHDFPTFFWHFFYRKAKK
jgi:hypothetical protein